MAYTIPPAEAAWIGDALGRAYDPDAVRAVFEEARTRFEMPAAPVADVPPLHEDDADEPIETPTSDVLTDLAAALLQRLGTLPALAAQTAVIEQVRDLRAQVAEALRAS